MKKAKQLSLMLVSSMLIASLAACGNNNGGKEAASTNAPAKDGAIESTEKVELTFWTLGNVNYEELGKEYTKEHPNVTIKVQNTGDQTAHHNNLTTALSVSSCRHL